MKDILILVATGFEDTELITSVNIFNREDISYDLVSVENLDKVSGQNEAIVKTEKINDIKTGEYRSIFLPGGKGHRVLLDDKQVIRLVKKYKDDNKLISAICAAPEVLLKAGVLDVKFTSFPGYAKNDLNTGKEVEVSKRIITGRDFLATSKFAQEVVKKIKR